jgi:hypothetical protein
MLGVYDKLFDESEVRNGAVAIGWGTAEPFGVHRIGPFSSRFFQIGRQERE